MGLYYVLKNKSENYEDSEGISKSEIGEGNLIFFNSYNHNFSVAMVAPKYNLKQKLKSSFGFMIKNTSPTKVEEGKINLSLNSSKIFISIEYFVIKGLTEYLENEKFNEMNFQEKYNTISKFMINL